MSWLQLRLDCGKHNAETLEAALLTAGALSVTLEDREDEPLLEPAVGATPLWQAIRITGLFAADTAMDGVLASLKHLDAAASARVEILEDKDWEREWMQHYEPMRFGERVWICPSWKEPPERDAVNLLLDPGLAFGTGTHPTTAMCLTALDGMTLDGSRVVDFGCGSGILGIAALHLGATSLLAVDNDPQALIATADNAERNGIDGNQLKIALPGDFDREDWQGTTDLVLANILAGPLAGLSEELCSFLAPGGQLVLAGLLDTQADALIKHYAPRLELSVANQQAEWVCLSGTLT
ncbi:50S ribosomal protein L11 methyltransferase [Congregibacter litoralis]|uniref:Ribosomal protein L11 methyltransferase n=1 Tax=Congregibacter litoralis KT71 TaxID=314285 RepID=A4A6T3_9GAMM|nr:50S ribosomal protein L11 methyltransferase [Congregibacter litoralis]EAQ98002.1 [LSU ribosomal protein L11P]-lysine N-methyltransferase [Congregibacter litoralis KT71]